MDGVLRCIEIDDVLSRIEIDSVSRRTDINSVFRHIAAYSLKTSLDIQCLKAYTDKKNPMEFMKLNSNEIHQTKTILWTEKKTFTVFKCLFVFLLSVYVTFFSQLTNKMNRKTLWCESDINSTTRKAIRNPYHSKKLDYIEMTHWNEKKSQSVLV